MLPDPEGLLRLIAVPGVGPNRLRALIAHFHTTDAIFRARVSELTRVEGIDRKTAESIRRADTGPFAQDQLDRLRKLGGELVSFWDSRFPEGLRRVSDPPAFLFVKGELREDDACAVAIVGTRSPTTYGKLVTERLTSDLVRRGLTIVSGFARGVDTLVHRAAIRAGGRTIAVLGTGLDVVYPPENVRLAPEVSENGALVTEYPLGTGPDAPNFPRRNRIICGMSLGTVVIEAGAKSGALITAELALEQNREVFAVPGPVNSPKSQGTNQLIREGAVLTRSAEDVIQELAPQLRQFLREREESQVSIELSDPERRVFESLQGTPKHIDHLALELGQPTSAVLSTLLTLELRGLVRQFPGKLFAKV